MKATRHGGDIIRLAREAGLPPDALVDFSANINPLGPPPRVWSVIAETAPRIVHYPEARAETLTEALAARHGLTAAQIVAGNGSSELLYALPRLTGKARALIPVPSYGDYSHAARLGGLEVETLLMEEGEGFRLCLPALEKRLRGDEAVFLGRPNNPTGDLPDASALRALARRHPRTFFIVDEAFIDFVPGAEGMIRDRPKNVVVLCSLTKFYALPGLRLGFAVGDEEIISALRSCLPPWSVNCLAQAVGMAVLGARDYEEETRRYVEEQREDLRRALSCLPGFHVYPATANYLLVRLDGKDTDARRLRTELLKHGIAVRLCDDFLGLDGRYFRVAVRTGEENARLLAALRRALGIPRDGGGDGQLRRAPPG